MSTGDTQCIGSCDLAVSFEVFADADYASKATDRGSVSGGEIMFACHPAPRRDWRSETEARRRARI